MVGSSGPEAKNSWQNAYRTTGGLGGARATSTVGGKYHRIAIAQLMTPLLLCDRTRMSRAAAH